MNISQVMKIQKLDQTVGWAFRPTIEVEGVGSVQVAPVMSSPGDKPKSYWALSPKHKTVAFADSPSEAVWRLIGKLS